MSYNTVYQAELSAILEAIRWFSRSGYGQLFLYTDSMSSVSALIRVLPTNDLLYEIFTTLRIMRNKTVHLGWIKAHVGIAGNERADELAKSAIVHNLFDEEVSVASGLLF